MDQDARCPSRTPNVRNKNFKEVALGYTEEMAMNEATALPALQEPSLRQRLPRQCAYSRTSSRKVAEGDFEGAYEVITSTNALPAVCGRVCPQETPVREQVRPRHQGRARRHRPPGALRGRLAHART